MRKFSVNGQFPQVFGQIAQKSTEAFGLRKISSPGNYVKNIVFDAVFVEFTDDFYF